LSKVDDFLDTFFKERPLLGVAPQGIKGYDLGIAREPIYSLLVRIEELEKAATRVTAWDRYENVDRQGGSFSQSEIDDANTWR